MDQRPKERVDEGSSTITLVVTNVVKPEHDEEFRLRAEEVAKQVRENEPGTLLYALTRVPSQSLAGIEVGDVFGHTYVWVERFRDEPALKAHMSLPTSAPSWARRGSGWSGRPSCCSSGRSLRHKERAWDSRSSSSSS